MDDFQTIFISSIVGVASGILSGFTASKILTSGKINLIYVFVMSLLTLVFTLVIAFCSFKIIEAIKKKDKKMNKNNKKTIFGTFMVIGLLLLTYFFASYFLENKKYEPLSSNWFNAGFFVGASDCLTIHTYYMQIDERKDSTHNEILLESKCNRDFKIVLTYPGVSTFSIGRGSEYITDKYINNSKVFLTINNSKVKEQSSAAIDINTKNKFDFYSTYDISNDPIANDQHLDFIYDGKKYICEEGCIAVIEGNLKEDRPILPREDFIRAKIMRWSDQRLLFSFAPQRVFIILLAKIIDGIFLGVVASFVFYLLNKR